MTKAPSNSADFAKWLYEKRMELGLSQAELGELAGVSGAMISSTERHTTRPYANTRHKLVTTVESLLENKVAVDNVKITTVRTVPTGKVKRIRFAPKQVADLDFTLEVTMPMSEWVKLRDALLNFPDLSGYQFVQLLESLVGQAKSVWSADD